MDDMSALERQLEREVRRAFGPPRPVDVPAIVRAAITPVDGPLEGRRRGRGWRLPALRRMSRTHAVSDTTGYPPGLMPGSEGHTATVIGKTRTTLRPATALVASALVLAIGGTLLVAQLIARPGGSVPGATTDRAGLEPASVVGTLSDLEESNHAGDYYAGDFYDLDDDSILFTREQWDEAGRLTMDDPRISGAWRGTVGINRYRSPDGAARAETYTGTITVANDAGTWVGTLLGCSGCGRREDKHVELVGTGAYEGLSALLYSGGNGSLYGVIVVGDLLRGGSDDLVREQGREVP